MCLTKIAMKWFFLFIEWFLGGVHGKLACSYCMENNKAFTLTNNDQTSFFNIINSFNQ